MIRVQLSAEQREELRVRAHGRGIAPRTRDRLEMVRLAQLPQLSGRGATAWPNSGRFLHYM